MAKRKGDLKAMTPVRDEGDDRAAALRALKAMLVVARTGATDIGEDALEEAIATACSVADDCILKTKL